MGNRVEKPILENAEEQALEVVKEELYSSSSDITKMSKNQLLDLMLRSTDELIRRSQAEQDDPRELLLQQLLSNSRGNTQAMVMLLKNTAEQLGVEKKYIRVVREDEPGTIKKLLKKTLALFKAAVDVAKEQITFSRIFNLAAIYRFGLTPYLIYGSAINSGLSILGIFNVAVAFGLSARYLYLHPDILKLLSKLQTRNLELLENIDLFVAAAALKSTLTYEISNLLKNGMILSELSIFVPFLSSSIDYIGWAASVLDFALNNKVEDITKAFVYWVQQKSQIFTYVWEAATRIKEQAVKAVQVGLGKGLKAIEASFRYVVDWWQGKAEKAIDAVNEKVEELELVSDRMQNIERGDVRTSYVEDYLPASEELLQLTGSRVSRRRS